MIKSTLCFLKHIIITCWFSNIKCVPPLLQIIGNVQTANSVTLPNFLNAKSQLETFAIKRITPYVIYNTLQEKYRRQHFALVLNAYSVRCKNHMWWHSCFMYHGSPFWHLYSVCVRPCGLLTSQVCNLILSEAV